MLPAGPPGNPVARRNPVKSIHPMKRTLGLALLFILLASAQEAGEPGPKVKVFEFPIRENIDKPAWRLTRISLEHALKEKADYIIIHLNTYGGRVDVADSIRTAILSGAR